jgi:hypothetical protein
VGIQELAYTRVRGRLVFISYWLQVPKGYCRPIWNCTWPHLHNMQ